MANPLIEDAIKVFFLPGVELKELRAALAALEAVTSTSDDWSRISGVMAAVRDSFHCFDTTRFIAVENEEKLEQSATRLFDNATFLVGFVFENVKTGDSELPRNLSAKIRMNVDNVPETNLVRPW